MNCVGSLWFNTATTLHNYFIIQFPITFSIFIVNVILSIIFVTIIIFQLIHITVLFFFKKKVCIIKKKSFIKNGIVEHMRPICQNVQARPLPARANQFKNLIGILQEF